jgi:hypothetical protein
MRALTPNAVAKGAPVVALVPHLEMHRRTWQVRFFEKSTTPGAPGTDPEPVALFRPHFRGWVAPR